MGRSDNYSAVLYDNTNGLPTSEANALAETSEGFLWIGSYSGLVRYDGNTFERIDFASTGISEEYIERLELGADGKVYGTTIEDDCFIIRDGVLADYLHHDWTEMRGKRRIR